MEVRVLLKGLVVITMIGCLLFQMWELFDQYLSEMKTVAVSFEEKNPIEFPSFAFCDSTAFTKRIGVTANATLYNATAFNVEVDVSIVRSSVSSYLTDNYTVQSVPTTDNGYCTLYELYGEYPVNTLFGKVKTTIDQLTI